MDVLRGVLQTTVSQYRPTGHAQTAAVLHRLPNAASYGSACAFVVAPLSQNTGDTDRWTGLDSMFVSFDRNDLDVVPIGARARGIYLNVL